MTDNRRKAVELAGEWVCNGRGSISRRQVTAETGISDKTARWLVAAARAVDYDVERLRGIEGPTEVSEPSTSKYRYDEVADVYLINTRRGNTAVAGTAVRALRSEYSSINAAVTMREVAHRHGLSRQAFDDLRAAMGWTKRDLPFTDEVIQSESEESLADDLVALKAGRIERAADRRQADIDRQDADKWRNLWRGVGGMLRDEVSAPTIVPFLRLPEDDRRTIVVVGLNDLHFGSYGAVNETGQKTNRESTTRRLFESTEFLIGRLSTKPEKFILPVSGDLVHIDTTNGTTTKGTPQDIDGTATEIAMAWLRTLRQYIDMLRQVAPVECIPLHGNHDYLLGTVILSALAEIYRDTVDVEVHCHGRRRHYIEWERNLLAFSHGDGVKYHALSGVVAAEASAAWGRCDSRHIWTGHLHHERVVEKPGCKTYIMPSIAGPDRFHEKYGFISEDGLMAYVVEADGLGVTQQLFAPLR